MGGGYEPPEEVYGVGFRATEESAGSESWITSCRADDGALRVESCRTIADEFDVDPRREAAVPALTRFVGGVGGGAAVGLDFPFGVPRRIVLDGSWEEFLYEFPHWFASAAEMRERCTVYAELVSRGREELLLRSTDQPLSAISPYDERIATETFHGIRDVLRPLVTSGRAVAVPIQEPDPERPSLLEVYPAGTLDTMSLAPPGSEPDPEGRDTCRDVIVSRLVDAGVELSDEVRDVVYEDDDALLAVVVAFATYRNTLDAGGIRTADEGHAHEGYIYV
ncbi:hypothetical protein ACFQE1_08170 [Halobium palmae]|uniref:DUF429 domain-containing protein n=1 Tax=Halobium palmae TaxID=1776492 RepID=A0ABD5RYT3_9EURY